MRKPEVAPGPAVFGASDQRGHRVARVTDGYFTRGVSAALGTLVDYLTAAPAIAEQNVT
ncbi:hypothetical protein [Candidatus Poriferisodalis sp.]|uniref:hypothetical protein n=1 Tax=Candidatus Poriferisodalis sp. TaxID=3101277 RepID=UPI003C704285